MSTWLKSLGRPTRASYLDPVYDEMRNDLISDVRMVGYRWYFNKYSVKEISSNTLDFRKWILSLKGGNYLAVDMFNYLLRQFWHHEIISADCVAVIPPSTSHELRPEYPLKKLLTIRGLRLPQIEIIRTRTIPPAKENSGSRNIETQYGSLDLLDENCLDGMKSVLLIDDISTSGSTLLGASKLIHSRMPELEITGFAFGKTTGNFKDGEEMYPIFPAPENIDDHHMNFFKSEFGKIVGPLHRF